MTRTRKASAITALRDLMDPSKNVITPAVIASALEQRTEEVLTNQEKIRSQGKNCFINPDSWIAAHREIRAKLGPIYGWKDLE